MSSNFKIFRKFLNVFWNYVTNMEYNIFIYQYLVHVCFESLRLIILELKPNIQSIIVSKLIKITDFVDISFSYVCKTFCDLVKIIINDYKKSLMKKFVSIKRKHIIF